MMTAQGLFRRPSGGAAPVGAAGAFAAVAGGLRAVGWAVPVVSVLALRLADLDGPRTAPATVKVVALLTVFGSLSVRVLITAWLSPSRRVALGALAAGLMFWVAGAAVLNAAPATEHVTFPSSGEWLFLAAYVGFAAWLVLDRAGATRPAAGGWLDAAIVYSGAACLASLLLVSPLADPFADRPVALLAALIYPMLDAVLLLLVLGQAGLRQRTNAASTGRLVVGFALLTVADLALVTSAGAGTYTYGEPLVLAWCLGFLLLGDAACGRSGGEPEKGGRSGEARPSAHPVVGAAAVAMVALLQDPGPGIRPYLLVPAMVTLCVVGLRLVLALRQAQRLNEALRLSRTDDLTGLPNRRALYERMTAALDKPGPLGLLLLDLDGFKEINDTLGHAAGDTVLETIAARVSAARHAETFAARLGGDEFAFLVAHSEPLDLLGCAERLRDVVGKPVRVDGLDITLGGSIGIAIRTPATLRPGDLLRQADIAMYQAKESRVGCLLYDAERDQFTRERLRIAEELRSALDDGQLVVWYQPKVDAATERPRGAEALIRWQHPQDGLVSPGVFLPVARRAGLMPALTKAMVRQVIRDLTAWHGEGLRVQVAINIAPSELLAPDVIDDLFAQLRGAPVPPASLIVEVTEDSFLTDPHRARAVIEGLRAEGLEVSIDDYGTGYSSLAYLRDLPVQELKIDRSFVADLLVEPRDYMIVQTTHELAKGLGLRTVAEGVEDAATAQALRTIGLDVLQGFLYARPMPPDQLPRWFAQQAVITLPRAGGPA